MWPTFSACTRWRSRMLCWPHQRPKLERYDNTLFLVLKTVNYVPHESVVLAHEIVETGEVMIFVGRTSWSRFAMASMADCPTYAKVWIANPEQLRLGPFAVMHAIADDVVDHYLEVTRLMECDIDAIEESGFFPGPQARRRADYLLKREGRRTTPVREPAVPGVPAVADREQGPDFQGSATLF